jgi:HAD superfamily hydrolase (TIGR01458 family)
VSAGPPDRSMDGLLLDIDGVLVVSWQPIPGAADALARIRSSGVPFRLVTNTTTVTRGGIAATLRGVGFDVSADEMLTAPMAAASYLREHYPGARCYLLGIEDIEPDLEGIDLVQEAADVVLVGGADEAFCFDNINRALRMVMAGARMVTMHRNLTWMEAEGISLDAGAYVLGLEAASGVKATVTGKPSREFFEACLASLGLPAERVAMVGDDVETDVLAAQRLGLTGILVRTGKFREDRLASASGRPDLIVGSISEVPSALLSGSAGTVDAARDDEPAGGQGP